MTPLERRVGKLEASRPADNNPLSNLTEAELDEQIFLGTKQMHDEGLKLIPETSLINIQCRQFSLDKKR